jgi:hypothetical protein
MLAEWDPADRDQMGRSADLVHLAHGNGNELCLMSTECARKLHFVRW